MRNVRKFCIAILVSIIICYACASDIKPSETNDNIQLRFRRHSKTPESSSESVKKQKQQQQQQGESEALTRSQLTRSTSSADNTVGDFAPIENNVKPGRNLLQNAHFQMRQLNNPLNAGGAFSYAFNYPHQGYPMQTLSPIMHQDYSYGHLNVAPHSFGQANNQFAIQPPITNFVNGQPIYSNSYAPHIMDFSTGQPGLTQYGQLNSQQNFPPSYGNNLIGQITLPYTQANLPPYNFGAYGEQIAKQLAPSDYMNIYGPNFIASSSLPGDVSAVSLLQPSQMSQPTILKPQLGLVHFGALPQNEINNGFGVPGGLLPNFIRNQRMLGGNSKE